MEIGLSFSLFLLEKLSALKISNLLISQEHTDKREK
jgi:hypothetical protein